MTSSLPDFGFQFEALAKDSSLDVLLPRVINLDAAALIRNGSLEELLEAPSRKHLLLDEQASILIVLSTTSSEEVVRTLLPRLELTVGAHAIDASPQGAGNPAAASGRHEVSTRAFAGSDFADLICHSGKTHVIFRPTLHLVRPRVRLQRPAIYFTANLALQADDPQDLSSKAKEYLSSFEPLPANVLEPLQFDSSLGSSGIFLPESRITKVAPKAPQLQDAITSIRGASKRAFPAIPVLFTQIKYSTFPDAVIASVHLESNSAFAGGVSVTRADLSVDGADVQDIGGDTFPVELRARDEHALLYRILAHTITEASSTSLSRPVLLTIKAAATLDQGPPIDLDISCPSHIGPANEHQKPVYRWATRPLSPASQQAQPTDKGNARPKSEAAETRQSQLEAGVTFSFTAPSSTPKKEVFWLDIQCINRSSRTRSFELTMLSPNVSSLLVQAQPAATGTDIIASVFSAPQITRAMPSDAMILNPNMRVGPVPTGACFDTRMEFQAMTTGVLNLGVLRITDLDTKLTVDVMDLPGVVALEESSRE